MKINTPIAAHLINIVFLSLILVWVVPDSVNAHSSPTWCPSGPSSGKKADQYEPGTFPGPAENFKMYRVDLAEFDLTHEFSGLPGRDMRARFWLMEPGGMIQEHCHDDRPALVYLLEGSVVETKMEGETISKNILPPPGWSGGPYAVAEANGTRHWWVNEGNIPVVMVAIDIPLRPLVAASETANWQWKVAKLPKNIKATKKEFNDKLKFSDEYRHIEDAHGRDVLGTHWTFQPGAVLGELDHTDRPAIVYVVEGEVLDIRSDQSGTELLRAGEAVTGQRGVTRYFYNASDKSAELVIFEIIHTKSESAGGKN